MCHHSPDWKYPFSYHHRAGWGRVRRVLQVKENSGEEKDSKKNWRRTWSNGGRAAREVIEPAALWLKRRTRIFCLNNLSCSGSFRSPNTAPFQFTVCKSCMCGYLLFGLRIPRVVKFPWMFGYGKTFAESWFSHHLLPEISRPGPRTCRVYSYIFNIFV